MNKSILSDILLIIGGMFFYGVRNLIGKWMVTTVLGLLKKILIRSERDLALYLHERNKAVRKRQRKV